MGNSSSSTISGSVPGACPEAAESGRSAHIPSRARERRLGSTVPRSIKGVTNGKQKLDISVDGKPYSVLIPAGLRPGDQFAFTITNDETPDVLVSTLHVIPGYDTLQSKSIIYGSISVYNWSQSSQGAAQQVGNLIEKVTDAIRAQALDQGCNAVLGIAYNVTNDSSGEYGREKTVVVTATGTPCIVVPARQNATAQGHAMPASASAPPATTSSGQPIPVVTAQAFIP
ncbi:hypothetical protein THAOC_11872 [Thalassiosira oceanica]|uniref:Uncharacterized protein n=1 Tax=Thalassiosira oceanica TaxID=159749 RepID=K0SLD5_THAOC|nr:hypothetical protein THAOC_11872 [Thalassiosira oceanica]|mmetsp:Transcript_29776/g.70786  ORF Transcript_29776/g.70786 Transcript_29776/m.70786 type:complete len:228 (-) Transcript_29776:84-767(-)|eukprot:EJK67138.1 hypothetical protein THAOC_11872 [Thalassiosira oceanica]